MKQIPLAIGPEPARTFDNFLPGANAEPLAHLLALAPGAPPVYLWGPEGSGKTHLLHAVVDRATRQGRHVAWFCSTSPTPWNAPEERDWIVIDDAHALDAERQQAAFALFVDATARGAVVVSAGAVPPVDLPVREDLRTRLGWGHVFALAPLGESEVRARIKRMLDIDGTRSVDSFHRELGLLLWDKCGMARNAAGLEEAIARIPQLREEFWSPNGGVSVLGQNETFNQSLERAGRVADFLEFGELMCRDARARDESCGGHFREEHQTAEGEALRDDENFADVFAWEYQGENGQPSEPKLHREPLHFESVQLATRSYK